MTLGETSLTVALIIGKLELSIKQNMISSKIPKKYGVDDFISCYLNLSSSSTHLLV
jgi:hypothetical protein